LTYKVSFIIKDIKISKKDKVYQGLNFKMTKKLEKVKALRIQEIQKIKSIILIQSIVYLIQRPHHAINFN
jgi:hypothetical protein